MAITDKGPDSGSVGMIAANGPISLTALPMQERD
jgi:hypothetical protein